MISVFVDSEAARAWVPFAKNKLAQIRNMGIPTKTLVIDEYTISLLSIDDIEKIRITSPPGTQVYAGQEVSMVADRWRAIWSFGDNQYGQLGVGSVGDKLSPVKIIDSTWRIVAPGFTSGMLIKADGTLWAVGILGYQPFPQPPVTATSPVKIADGKWAAITTPLVNLAVNTDGSLWGWGNLRDGSSGFVSALSIEHLSSGAWEEVSVIQLTAVIARKKDGTLWRFSKNPDPRLDLGYGTLYVDWENPSLFSNTDGWRSLAGQWAVRADGTLWDITGAAPERFGTDKWAMVAQWAANGLTASDTHTMAIKPDGTLWAWGANNAGQLGLGDTTARTVPTQVGADRWSTVSAGVRHTLGVRTDGTLWAWGSNSKGQLGTGDLISSSIPVKLNAPVVRAGAAPGRVL